MDDEYGPACPHCGGDTALVECDRCNGEGWTEYGELYELDQNWYTKDHIEPCSQCGAEERYICRNTYEWCQAHPLPGCEEKPRSVVTRAARA